MKIKMKKSILALALLTVSSSAAFAFENEAELMEAPSDYVSSLVAQCKEYAQEDEVSKAEMKAYLLTCVNDELEEAYYLSVKVLP